MDYSEKKAGNALESLLLSVIDLYHYYLNFCPSFKKDIKRYPDLYKRILSYTQLIQARYMGYFTKGIEQGIFHPDFDYERISEIIIEQIGNRENLFQHHYLIIKFLRKICTEKGVELLHSFNPVTLQRYN